MHVYGPATIADLLGEYVAYRNLHPLDPRLPGAGQIAPALGIAPGAPLRKGDEDYARVVAELLAAARALDAPGVPLRRLILVGDTRMSDGAAFTSLCAVTGWRGRAFIAQEDGAAPPASILEGDTTFANRWAALNDFVASLDAEGFVDQQTVVAVDLDKTLIGARGRNDQLIDSARLRALQDSVAAVLGSEFDLAGFAQIYRALNQTRFHTLTGDNQDYVGYLCVSIAAGIFTLDELIRLAVPERPRRFEALLHQVKDRCAARGWPSAAVESFHNQFANLVAAGDPTPFKAFRYREYAETAALMGGHPDNTAPDELLRAELVLTAEVWQAARAWGKRGALLFGLSDKPDEAALPEEQFLPGARPLHHIKTHIVGAA